MADLSTQLNALRETNVTQTTHRDRYAAILPSRPELSQKDKVILITGGGTGVGFAIAKAFAQASAKTIILVGRRADVLEAAASRVQQEAKKVESNSKIISQTCDIANVKEVESLWERLAAQNLTVDVLVACAAKFTDPKPILTLGADEIWSQVETNVKAPLYLTEKFNSQPGEGQKFIVHVSTQSVHMMAHPGVAARPGYTLSKMAATLLYQVIAQNEPPKKLQIVNFHPGLIYNDQWQQMGLGPGLFDDDGLCGAFAVWAASPEAEFLHGRFVWASWDVNELATGEVRKRIDEDPYYLRCSIAGLNGTLAA